METAKLSAKGRVILPRSVRDTYGWKPGTEFVIESTPDGVLLRVKPPFARTQLDQVFGSVRYAGPAKSLDDMGGGIRAAARRHHERAPR